VGDAIREFFNSKGIEKTMRFLANEDFCHSQCDFLEDNFCTRFDKDLDLKDYIVRCEECKEFTKSL
jgi:hypothetical protein